MVNSLRRVTEFSAATEKKREIIAFYRTRSGISGNGLHLIAENGIIIIKKIFQEEKYTTCDFIHWLLAQYPKPSFNWTNRFSTFVHCLIHHHDHHDHHCEVWPLLLFSIAQCLMLNVLNKNNEIIFDIAHSDWSLAVSVSLHFSTLENWLQAYNYIKLAFCTGLFFFFFFHFVFLMPILKLICSQCSSVGLIVFRQSLTTNNWISKGITLLFC